MIIITTMLAPLLLRKAYDKESPEEASADTEQEPREPPDFIPTYPLVFDEKTT
jgi:hypothetical protein